MLSALTLCEGIYNRLSKHYMNTTETLIDLCKLRHLGLHYVHKDFYGENGIRIQISAISASFQFKGVLTAIFPILTLVLKHCGQTLENVLLSNVLAYRVAPNLARTKRSLSNVT